MGSVVYGGERTVGIIMRRLAVVKDTVNHGTVSVTYPAKALKQTQGVGSENPHIFLLLDYR